MTHNNSLLGRQLKVLCLASLMGVAIPAFASPYSSTVLSDSPTAFWQLNESSGTTALDSAGSHNGSYTNAVIGQQGYNAGSDPGALAAVFGPNAGQSQDSYVGGMSLDFATNGNAQFSVEAWVNGPQQITSAGIVGKGTGGQEEFYLDCGNGAQGAFRFFVRNAAGTASVANSTFVADNNWHYLVGVCDEAGGHIYLYLDGLQVASATVSGGIRTSSNQSMNIGSRQSTSAGGPYDFQFNGTIGDVAVYNYALNATQIQNHYFSAGIPPRLTLTPVSSIITNANTAITLSGAAYGSTPLSYQWYLNSVPLSGQTSSVFSTNSVPAAYNGGTLMLVASNSFGTISASTFLTIYSGPPQIVTDVQPSSVSIYTGLTFAYSVTAQGDAPLYYQWLKDGSAIGGATSSGYTATAGAGTNNYSVIVSNTASGGSAVTSSASSLIGVPAPTAAYAAHILSDHPSAYWRLDDATNSSTASEYAGGHTGTYNNAALGDPGYSPTFDPDTAATFGTVSSTDSYMQENDNSGSGIPLLDFAQPAGSNAAFSVEAWVKGPAGQNSSGSCIVAKGTAGSDEFVLDSSAGGGNDYRFYIRKAGTAGTAIINGSAGPDGSWHHLVAVCDEASGGMFLYVDGALNSQVTGLSGVGLFSSSVPISVGAQNSGSGSYNYQFVGTIDDVSVYNYALSSAQVLAHYQAAPLLPYFVSQPPTNILAYLGQPITLSATVLGTGPLTNQWYSNNIALSGKTNVSLVVNTGTTGTNTYTLRVSNVYGSITNLGTVLQIPAGSGPPTLLSDISPVSGSRYAGLSITYSVVASGSAPLSYRWYSNSIAIPGATTSSYSISNLQAVNQADYYVIVSNSISTIQSSTSTLTVVPAPTNIYPIVVVADHPVAYFRLDEPVNSPFGYDYVGGNVGQYTSLLAANYPLLGVPGYDAGLDPDTACKFGLGGTGVNNTYLGNTISNIDFSQPNGQNGAFSLEAWINGTAGVTQTGGGTILAKGRGSSEEQFSIDINNGIRFYVRNASGATLVNAQAAASLTGSAPGTYQMDGKWHHLVGVCDQVNSNLLLYVDGKLIGPDVITNGVVPTLVYALDLGVSSTGTNGVIGANTGIEKPTTTQDLVNTLSIGNRNKSSAHSGTGAYDLPFEGVIDDVALYNYVLTPAQVANHYNIGAGVRVPLTVRNINGKAVVSWTGTATLQSSSTVLGPWTVINGAISPYTNNLPGSLFYRLKLH